MSYYLKYLKYKQKYLDLKNLDLFGGISLGNYNYNDLEGGVIGIASDYPQYAHLIDDYGNEAIADYWRTEINSTTFSINAGHRGTVQPGYYLMYYDSNGEYNDVTEDAEESHDPKFFDNHIHLLSTSILENGYNAINFTVKLNGIKIKINDECLVDAIHLNKYCKKNGIVGYDKLRMMILLFSFFTNLYHTESSAYKFKLNLNINSPKSYTINGNEHPYLTTGEITKCIEVLETFAIICTAISKIEEINTRRTTGEINPYDDINPAQYNQYLEYTADNDRTFKKLLESSFEEKYLDDSFDNTPLDEIKIQQQTRFIHRLSLVNRLSEKKVEEFLKKKDILINSNNLFILPMKNYNDRIKYMEKSISDDKSELIEIRKVRTGSKSMTEAEYIKIYELGQKMISDIQANIQAKETELEKYIKDNEENYNKYKQQLLENANEIRTVNDDNSHFLYDWFDGSQWFEWLAKRKDMTKIRQGFKKRENQRISNGQLIEAGARL